MTTFEPCQQTLFDETECGPSMSSPAASHVRTYHMLASELALKVSDLVYGRSSPDLLARFDPALRSWKTPQASLVPGMDEFSETWPRSGMMQRGTAYPLPPSAPLTGGTASGLWPTATAQNAKHGSLSPAEADRVNTGKAGLHAVVQMWPTPQAGDAKVCMTGTQNQFMLPHAVAQFATPQSRDYRTGSEDRWNDPARSRNLNDQIGGSLNPDWVEWLMGFRTGWTQVDGWKSRKASPALPQASKTAPRG